VPFTRLSPFPFIYLLVMMLASSTVVSSLRRSYSLAMTSTAAATGTLLLPQKSHMRFMPAFVALPPLSLAPLPLHACGSKMGSGVPDFWLTGGSPKASSSCQSRPQAPSSRLAAVVSRSTSRSKATSSIDKRTAGVGGGDGMDTAGGRESPSIPLSPAESRLFETMLAVVKDENLGTTLRVAGGWVRDKVLGHWSADGEVDIDIALDNLMGSDFAAMLNGWLAKRGRQVYNVGIISANPTKSKHLETATMRVGSFSIDFVNLRTEAYTDESRIPSMGIGSPEEDAMR